MVGLLRFWDMFYNQEARDDHRLTALYDLGHQPSLNQTCRQPARYDASVLAACDQTDCSLPVTSG